MISRASSRNCLPRIGTSKIDEHPDTLPDCRGIQRRVQHAPLARYRLVLQVAIQHVAFDQDILPIALVVHRHHPRPDVQQPRHKLLELLDDLVELLLVAEFAEQLDGFVRDREWNSRGRCHDSVSFHTCNSTTSLSCSTWSRVTVWPSNTPVPQMRADFSLSAISRCTNSASCATVPPTGSVNGDPMSAGLPGRLLYTRITLRTRYSASRTSSNPAPDSASRT